MRHRGFIHLNGGFQPGKLYEYVYVVADPVVAGSSFAMFRDFASYAKHDPKAITPVQRVYGEGISQNGRFLRNFLYEGFNADEDGKIALDGVLAHVAGAGRGSAFFVRSRYTPGGKWLTISCSTQCRATTGSIFQMVGQGESTSIMEKPKLRFCVSRPL